MRLYGGAVQEAEWCMLVHHCEMSETEYWLLSYLEQTNTESYTWSILAHDVYHSD